MNTYSIRKPTDAEHRIAEANNGKINKGHLFELAMALHTATIETAKVYRVDNVSYKVGFDLGNMELKSARATMGDIWDETLVEFAGRRMTEGKAQVYAVGLDLIYDDEYAVIEMSAEEMKWFVVQYGVIMDMSSKNKRPGNSGKVVRLDGLRSKTAQEDAWRRAHK